MSTEFKRHVNPVGRRITHPPTPQANARFHREGCQLGQYVGASATDPSVSEGVQHLKSKTEN